MITKQQVRALLKEHIGHSWPTDKGHECSKIETITYLIETMDERYGNLEKKFKQFGEAEYLKVRSKQALKEYEERFISNQVHNFGKTVKQAKLDFIDLQKIEKWVPIII